MKGEKLLVTMKDIKRFKVLKDVMKIGGSGLDRVTENAEILSLGIYKQIKASEISLVI